MHSVEYIKGQHLYWILIPSAHILLSFCVRIGAFDRSRVFVLVQVFRVQCTLFVGVRVQRTNVVIAVDGSHCQEVPGSVIVRGSICRDSGTGTTYNGTGTHMQ